MGNRRGLGLEGNESFTIESIADEFAPGKILEVRAGDTAFK